MSHAEKLASAQRRGHKRRAKRIHRKAARCRADALHKFSRSIVDRYQTIVVGDVSSSKLVKTRMANSVLDSSWGKLKGYLEYKSQQAARSFEAVSERNTSVTCSQCKSLTGPRGVNGLIVRSWICGDCGESHDRDVNAARSILNGSRGWTSVRGNEPSSLADSAEPRLSRARGRDRISLGGGMNTGSMPVLTQRELKTLLPTVFAALAASDAIVMRQFTRIDPTRKSDGSEVTSADRAAERQLRRSLRAAWPADPVHGEEYGGVLARTGRCWLIDPIDGTASYVLGMPMFGTLIALIVDGQPIFGCIHLPALRETTYAASGHGCWMFRPGARPRRVHVAKPRRLQSAKVGMTAFKERKWLDQSGAREVAALAAKVGRLRMVGDCVQYPLVCRGVLDAAIDPRMKPWDIAAVAPCILEAGGAISDLEGNTSRIIDRHSIVAASSDALRRQICRAKV